MVAIVLGSLVIALGLPFLVRGWIFSLRPQHAISRRARERNLRLGLEPDMHRWGRRVRRVGLCVVIVGAAWLSWGLWSL